MKWEYGCGENHNCNISYHPIRGKICSLSGRKIQTITGTTVNE